jgi:glycerol-3-phosphate dehydrogenase
MHDVIIIGSGLIRVAIAYDLSVMELNVDVLEREGELGAGASRSNSGVLHTGFDSEDKRETNYAAWLKWLEKTRALSR